MPISYRDRYFFSLSRPFRYNFSDFFECSDICVAFWIFYVRRFASFVFNVPAIQV